LTAHDYRAINRRQLLHRGGSVLVLSLAGVGGLASNAFADLASPPALSVTRRRSYQALIEALSVSGNYYLDSGRSDQAVEWLANSYASGDEAERSRVDVILDGIDTMAPSGRRFSDDTVTRRRQLLRDARSDTRRAVGPRRAAELCYEAITLAVTPFMPQGARWSATEFWV
jgi:hypothetical protein